MRFLLKVNIPVEAGNAAAKAGKLGATIQSILADFEARGRLFHGQQRTAHGVHFPRYAGRFPNPSDR